ncbi:hypothetical protein [Leifsonia sp. NPDC080035]|uniref:Uncharacterized protein n=1 Tax=Leifsonia sp. NPDC080035 TaxID=3143936 RepID=A0AAU7G8D1_9MICO
MSQVPRPVPSSRPRRVRADVLTRVGWIGVLLLTSVFHFVRGAPVDGVIYAAGAVVLALDGLGWLRIPLRLRADRDTVRRRVAAGVLIAVASLTLAVTPLYSGADTAIVVGLGVLLLPVAWANRPGPAADTDRAALRRAAIAWSVLIAAGCLWEVGTFFLGRGTPGGITDFPALSDLTDPLVAWPPARAVLVACWLLGGYALVRRGWAR